MPTELEFCQQIVEEARNHVGCHYLWGAAGDTPDGEDGYGAKKNAVKFMPYSTDPKNPYIFAACCSSNAKSDLHVCGGIWKNEESLPGGRKANSKDQDLIDYLNQLNALPADEWQPYYVRFTPRKILGYSEKDHSIVWGEDCRNIRHFDCIGFVNYCIQMVLKWPKLGIAMDIPQWSKDKSGTKAVKVTDPFYPADILIQSDKGNLHHIGLMLEEGFIINAEETSQGVRIRKFNPAKWQIRRLPTRSILHYKNR